MQSEAPMTHHQFSRRTMLRGLGVTHGAALAGIAAASGATSRTAASSASEAPVRLAVLFSGNGFHSKEWWAKGEGKTMELGQVLAPLTDFREKMLFIRGLYNERGAQGQHSQLADRQPALRRAAGLGRRDSLGHQHRSVAGADATAARPKCRAWCWAARSRTRRSTRTTRCSTARTFRGRSPTTPTPLELYPALAFDRLFKDEVQRGDKSVLDAVLTDASDLRRQISTTDQRKLDEYLDSVRDVEQRIDNAGKQGELQGWRPTLDKPNIPRPADGIPQNIAEHMRLMCDILVLGFQTDTTRITHAQAEQRSLVAALPASGRRLHDPPPAVALRHGRLAEGESVLRRATGLHRPQARRDPGRRAHGARQLDAAVSARAC